MTDGSRTLGTLLRRMRRRAIIVRFARYAAGVAVVFPLGAAALLIGGLPGVAVAISVAACAAIAAAAAVIRTPDLRAIAAVADARLGLADRVVTAVQHADDRDMMSRLVVRDAVARLQSSVPARVFPFEMPSRLGSIAAGAIVIAAIAVIGSRMAGVTSSVPGISPQAGGSGGRPGAPTQSGSAQTGRGEPGTMASPGAGADPARGSSAETAGVTPPSSAAPSSIAPSAAAPSAADPSSAAPSAAVRTNAPENQSALSALGRPVDTSTRAGGSRIPGERDLRSGGSGSATAGRTSRGAGGAGSAADGAARPGAGASAADSESAARRLNALDGAARDYAARYRESSSRAEAAIASDRVPPGMRAYVRAYFTAIRPPVERLPPERR